MSRRSLILALTTIFLWSTLALLGSRLSHIPPLFVVGAALVVGGLVGLVRVRSWRVPWPTLAVGVGGLFGYHYLLFTAFQLAPPVEANLLNYLWPLLIVLLSPVFLSGHGLRGHHLIGACLGLVGAGLIIGQGRLALEMAHLPGYLMAAAAALVWASYSLMTKRLPPFPTAAVAGFCLGAGLLSLAVHGLKNSPPLTLTTTDMLLLALLGLGPMGVAFLTWDGALKGGDPRVIGALAYLTPLTSTLLLVLLGGQALTAVSAAAMALIVAGAVIGSLDLLLPRER